MLKLFANVFGQSDDGRSKLPPALVKQAIERAVDATDPRVRIHFGYAKVLRQPVIHAVEYVIDLVDGFPHPGRGSGIERCAQDHRWFRPAPPAHITERKEERNNLTSRKALLRSKLDIMRRGGGFAQHTGALDQAQLQTRLEDIETQLSELGATEDTLSDNLAIIAGVLAEAENHFWFEDKVLCLDKLYVLHDKPEPSVPPTVFKELHNSEGLQVTYLMISIGSKQ